jgi:hypothetical protein
MRRVSLVILGMVCVTAGLPAAQAVEGRAITYVGVSYDQTDFRRLNVGDAGYWFPQFDAPVPVSERPTGERAVDARPPWVAPLNHVAALTDLGCEPLHLAQGCLPTYLFRSFSQDGPARSKGGEVSWNSFRLPDGRRGRSGAVVDPFTAGNVNNTINRIQLRGDVPSTFYFHVVTDNTNRQHDPTGQLRARGNAGPIDEDSRQVDTDVFPNGCDLTFNGVADVYTFRYTGFAAGDYLKLRLEGDAGMTGASFGGVLFDETFDPAGPFQRAPRGGPPPVTC